MVSPALRAGMTTLTLIASGSATKADAHGRDDRVGSKGPHGGVLSPNGPMVASPDGACAGDLARWLRCRARRPVEPRGPRPPGIRISEGRAGVGPDLPHRTGRRTSLDR